MTQTFRPALRDAVNVTDELARDQLVQRMRALRAEAVLERNTIRHWNRAHPTERPFSTACFDAVIAYYAGTGPLEDVVRYEHVTYQDEEPNVEGAS